MKTLGIEQISELLHKSVSTIYMDVERQITARARRI